ncbi:TPA: hypothetical protein L5C46_003696 [Pseudomonas aeruginosa]|nr:hypothetical protein [Pseudomonas aeruginosa]
MERLSTVQAAHHLHISRPTMRKLRNTVLPPDEVSGSGRPYWYRSTLDNYRAGLDTQKAIALYIRCVVDGIGLGDDVTTMPLLKEVHLREYRPASGTRTEQLIEVLHEIQRVKPAAVVLPFQRVLTPPAAVVTDLCYDLGIAVVLQGKV